VLRYERVIGLYFLDEGIITSSLFLHMLENYGLPQLNSTNNLTVLQLNGHLFILLMFSMTECGIPRSVDRRGTNLVASLFS
jgi:hypothetical protein